MNRRLVGAVLALTVLAAACTSEDDAATSGSGVSVTETSADRATGGGGTDGSTSSDGSADGGTADPVPETEADRTAPGAATEIPAGDESAPEGLSRAVEQLALNAGWVDDNEQFADYLDFLDGTAIEGVTLVDVAGREVIRVVDRSGRPIAGAEVELLVGDDVVHEARTHADGRVFAFPIDGEQAVAQQRREPVYRARVRSGGETTEFDLAADTDAHELTLERDRTPTTALDVLFLIDATGSMSDEIDQLKANMATVATEIAADQGQRDLRFAMVTYRDHGDEYLTRTTDFTDDVVAFGAELDAVTADGGGDNPEAVDEALTEAIDGVAWRPGEAIGLVFLVADAPPHLDDPQNPADYADAAVAANEAGIKVFPVASSGLDPAGEYVFRQIAQITGAPFVFLTYGAGGGPGTERPEFDVHDYSVLALDQLIVRLVTEEIGHQTDG